MNLIFRDELFINTDGRGSTRIDHIIERMLRAEKLRATTIHTCHLWLAHTSASLIVCENAAPEVRSDFETFLSRLVLDGDPTFCHQDEGPDDMPAHIRTMLTQTSLTIPVEHSSLKLGRWQGIYLYEHRTHAHTRGLTMSFYGI